MADSRKLLPESLGVVDAGLPSANKGMVLLNRTTTNPSPSVEALRAVTARVPPETHALLLLNLLGYYAQVVRNFRLLLLTSSVLPEMGASETETATRLDTLRETYLAQVTMLRQVVKRVREAVALRAADGWPEWDFERGCPVGGSPVGYATDDLLLNVLASMNWGDDDA